MSNTDVQIENGIMANNTGNNLEKNEKSQRKNGKSK